MSNLDSITNENHKEHNKRWLYIPYHPYRILIIGGSGSGKTNILLHLIREQNVIDKIYLYAKDLSESKYEYLIKKLLRAHNLITKRIIRSLYMMLEIKPNKDHKYLVKY